MCSGTHLVGYPKLVGWNVCIELFKNIPLPEEIKNKNEQHSNCYLATAWGWNKPADSDIKCVSSGLVLFSVANPGVSVSGGQFTVTFMLKGDSSNEKIFKSIEASFQWIRPNYFYVKQFSNYYL